jgi:small subunit ribosomal protein S13
MRVAGITLPDNKQLEFGLTYLYGIGRPRAKELCKQAGVSHTKKIVDLTEEEESKLRELIDVLKIEGDLRREVQSNIQRLKDIKTYRGSRHTKNLPVRGQRTKTNNRTRRGGKRMTMGSGRKKVEKK